MTASRPHRRSHSDELTAEVVAACEGPGLSVAEVSRRYGLNTNLVQTWRRHPFSPTWTSGGGCTRQAEQLIDELARKIKAGC